MPCKRDVLRICQRTKNAHATGIFKDKSTALRFSKSLAIKVRDSITYRSQVATVLSERAMYEE
ncbi:hypothetical protein LT214_002303 [Enterococcus faecalis]|uniref:hypothetical protein n=1 Tax=Enterococcus faecalis TaxID=1351 RepID=UPI0021E03208|nr:hypothetical protein [Enterococcus faecalis]EIP8158348.1 hypothetical protein [Enterococcus faecalis]